MKYLRGQNLHPPRRQQDATDGLALPEHTMNKGDTPLCGGDPGQPCTKATMPETYLPARSAGHGFWAQDIAKRTNIIATRDVQPMPGA